MLCLDYSKPDNIVARRWSWLIYIQDYAKYSKTSITFTNAIQATVDCTLLSKICIPNTDTEALMQLSYSWLHSKS